MKKILTIYSTDLMRSFISNIIKNCNLEPTEETNNVNNAIEIIKVLKPDIIVVYIKVPELENIEVIRRLKSLNVGSQFIVITDTNRPSIINEILSLGAVSVITKQSKKH